MTTTAQYIPLSENAEYTQLLERLTNDYKKIIEMEVNDANTKRTIRNRNNVRAYFNKKLKDDPNYVRPVRKTDKYSLKYHKENRPKIEHRRKTAFCEKFEQGLVDVTLPKHIGRYHKYKKMIENYIKEQNEQQPIYETNTVATESI